MKKREGWGRTGRVTFREIKVERERGGREDILGNDCDATTVPIRHLRERQREKPTTSRCVASSCSSNLFARGENLLVISEITINDTESKPAHYVIIVGGISTNETGEPPPSIPPSPFFSKVFQNSNSTYFPRSVKKQAEGICHKDKEQTVVALATSLLTARNRDYPEWMAPIFRLIRSRLRVPLFVQDL